MDDLAKRREAKASRDVKRRADATAPDLALELWFGDDDQQVRQLSGSCSKAPCETGRDQVKLIHHLLDGTLSIAQDLAEDGEAEDSWRSEPLFLIFTSRDGTRYMTMHKFFIDESETFRSRWVSTIYMLRRTWGVLRFMLRLTWKLLRGGFK